MIDKLCKQIERREGYQHDYETLSQSSSLLYLRSDITIDTECIVRLLRSATTFALSADEKYRKQAYSIAIMTRNVLQYIVNEDDREKIEAIIVVILSRLGNFPAEKKFLY